MALTNADILRLKAELFYNVVGIGAEAYSSLDGYVALFDRAVQPYLIDYGTTSSTVVAVGAGVTTLTLAANPTVPGNNVQPLAFAAGTNVVVDLGPNAEKSTILAISGLIVTLTLSLAHGGYTYPVLVQGGEQLIRDIFTQIDTINSEMRTIAPKTAGIEQVDEVKLYASGHGRRNSKSKFDELVFQRHTARRDLAALLGVPYLFDVRGGQSQSFEVY